MERDFFVCSLKAEYQRWSQSIATSADIVTIVFCDTHTVSLSWNFSEHNRRNRVFFPLLKNYFTFDISRILKFNLSINAQISVEITFLNATKNSEFPSDICRRSKKKLIQLTLLRELARNNDSYRFYRVGLLASREVFLLRRIKRNEPPHPLNVLPSRTISGERFSFAPFRSEQFIIR